MLPCGMTTLSDRRRAGMQSKHNDEAMSSKTAKRRLHRGVPRSAFSLMNEVTFQDQKIILFDGICNLCNGSVIFVLQRERKPIFKFASLQSQAGRELLLLYGLPPDYNQAVVLIDHGKLYLGSTAA